jgi:putrescine aminotransferase
VTQTDNPSLLESTIARYARHVNPGLAKLMSFAGFGAEVRGEGCYLFDQDGRKFLDCLGGYGVFSLGHRHPRVVEAVRRQLDELPLSGKVFFSPRAAELAEKLAGIAPAGLELCFFSNTGTEAVEAALKFAKAATGRTRIVATEGGYHGKTTGALAVTGREKYRRPFGELMPGAAFVPYGDAGALAAATDRHTAAVILEPVQGEGGIHIPPEGYLRAARAACDATGAVLILDEVQTGLGRTGRMFGCDHEGVAPDLMTLAKALGGGVMPIGATLGTAAVWDMVFAENPLAHTSTFGGNPLACAAGLAAVGVIEDENLVERSRETGAKLLAGLRQVQAAHPDLLKEVRGRGLMAGVEFAMDDAAELTIAQMTVRGVVAAYTLNNPRVIRFEPPLIIEEAQVRVAVDVFAESLAETASLLATLG